MNIFRGLLELIGGGRRKPDSGGLTAPPLKEILATLKGMANDPPKPPKPQRPAPPVMQSKPSPPRSPQSQPAPVEQFKPSTQPPQSDPAKVKGLTKREQVKVEGSDYLKSLVSNMKENSRRHTAWLMSLGKSQAEESGQSTPDADRPATLLTNFSDALSGSLNAVKKWADNFSSPGMMSPGMSPGPDQTWRMSDDGKSMIPVKPQRPEPQQQPTKAQKQKPQQPIKPQRDKQKPDDVQITWPFLPEKKRPQDDQEKPKPNKPNRKNDILGQFLSGKKGAVGNIAGKMLGKAGGTKLAGMFAKLAGTAGLVLGLAAAAAFVTKKLYAFADNLNESNRSIAQFSGQMSAAFAQLDIQKIQNDIRTARATEGSGSALTDEMREFRRDIQPIKESVITIKNTLAKGGLRLLRFATKFAEGLPEIQAIKKIAELIEQNTRDEHAVTPTQEQITELASGRWAKGTDDDNFMSDPLPPIL